MMDVHGANQVNQRHLAAMAARASELGKRDMERDFDWPDDALRRLRALFRKQPAAAPDRCQFSGEPAMS